MIPYFFVGLLLTCIYLTIKLLDGIWQIFILSYIISSVFSTLCNFFRNSIVAFICIFVCYGAILWLVIEVIPIVKMLLETIISNFSDIAEYVSNFKPTNVYFENMLNDIISYIHKMLKSLLTESSSTIYSWCMYCIISPLLSFYILLNRELIQELIIHRTELGNILFYIHENLKKYLVYQTLVCLIMCIYYCVLFSFFQIKYAISLGTLIGAIAFIPYIGFAIGFIVSSLTVLTYHTSYYLYYIIFIFIGAQVLENGLLVPMLIGKHVAGNPLVVLISMMLANHILGATGALLAVPIICCVRGVLRWSDTH